MRLFSKLFILILLVIPTMFVVGCGPSQVTSDVAPDNTGDDSSDEDNSGAVGSVEDE
jgi:hypothetical protein